MSRTYKDMPQHVRFPESHWNMPDRYYKVEYEVPCRQCVGGEWVDSGFTITTTRWLQKPGAFRKKRREVDTQWHWMSTPSWWTRLTMNRPQRRAGRLWERDAVCTPTSELDILEHTSVSKKPHCYYW